MKCYTASTVLLLISTSLALFPGRQPDRGDYRHLYPRLFLAIGVRSHAHSLPYTLGLIENLEYPKDRLQIAFFVEDNKGADGTEALVKTWARSAEKFYREKAIRIFGEEHFEDSSWMEVALMKARGSRSEYALLTTGDEFLTQPRILQNLIALKKTVVVPLMNSPTSNHSNSVDDMGDRYVAREIVGLEEITHASMPMLIHISASGYLTFSSGNVLNFDGNPNDPIEVFAHSAATTSIPIFLSNEEFYGYFIDSKIFDLPKHRQQVKHFIANLISDYGIHPIPPSSAIPPRPRPGSRLGFDQIYLINLKRRPERLRKMDAILQLFGIDYTLWEATDGKRLEEDEYSKEIKILPGYEDPFYKRTLKNGEIGCFLSHYRIWKNVVENGYEKVLVFEDDLRFLENGTQRLLEAMEDIEKHETEWDLIYLGRKNQAAEGEELWVADHRHLSTVGYSYWTLGYALSHSGAEKLLKTDPLSKLVAVDEYIPIMFDRHPRADWKNAFPERDLKAFTLYPLMVVPERYTNQDGYISDTEDSPIVDVANRGEGPKSDLKAPLRSPRTNSNEIIFNLLTLLPNCAFNVYCQALNCFNL
ncbi:hypothetical protein L596_023488 [Steinernema carpocapsae]|uniref:Glycosyl transferase family 25 domain-containing protein n=1 Tax=Steinernema carpocapsae TaxID=34508 RepID=A0A4U5MDT2_STECR|nr:hypothetical protein L596_023488 [Steinernema carpocapsae]